MSADACGPVDLENVATDLTTCPTGHFGPECAHSFSRSREYLPAIQQNASLPRRQCASAWFRSWLCGLAAAPHDPRHVTAGKTLLHRVFWAMAATLARRASCRSTIDQAARAWSWRPAGNSTAPACRTAEASFS